MLVFSFEKVIGVIFEKKRTSTNSQIPDNLGFIRVYLPANHHDREKPQHDETSDVNVLHILHLSRLAACC